MLLMHSPLPAMIAPALQAALIAISKIQSNKESSTNKNSMSWREVQL